MKNLLIVSMLILAINTSVSQDLSVLNKNKWSVEKAENWYANYKWITGANFLPSTAINQLEMWQVSTFDAKTIDRELGFASGIGFNTMRVYLHSLAYKVENPVKLTTTFQSKLTTISGAN